MSQFSRETLKYSTCRLPTESRKKEKNEWRADPAVYPALPTNHIAFCPLVSKHQNANVTVGMMYHDDWWNVILITYTQQCFYSNFECIAKHRGDKTVTIAQCK